MRRQGCPFGQSERRAGFLRLDWGNRWRLADCQAPNPMVRCPMPIAPRRFALKRLADIRAAWRSGARSWRFLCISGAAWALPLHADAEVWKCSLDGRVHYSDLPCPTNTQADRLAPRTLQGNVIEVGRPMLAEVVRTAPPPAALPDESMPARAAPPNVCPSDRDIASMETTASSISLPPEAKRFVQDEIRRARQCQKGLGRYSAADWAISRDAVAAQSSLSGAADARIRSESMHSAANPAEGELIARRQEAELRPIRVRPQWAPSSGHRIGSPHNECSPSHAPNYLPMNRCP